MSTELPDQQRPVEPAAQDSVSGGVPPTPVQPVSLIDTIPWWWYLIGFVVPLVGAVAGIVFMARSKIGPALALWATCFLGVLFWSGIGLGVAYVEGSSGDDSVSTSAFRMADDATDPDEAYGSGDTDTATQDDPGVGSSADYGDDDLSAVDPPADEPDDPAADDPAADEPAYVEEGPSEFELKACGNLEARRGTTTCAFAQNVFWSYWTAENAEGESPAQLLVFSPALGRSLAMDCSGSTVRVCKNDSGARVHIPAAALNAYTQTMADDYASSHEVG